MKRTLASLAGIAAMASVVLGSGSSPYSYLDTKNIDYGPYRRIQSRTKQRVGHYQKMLAIRRKRNKAAKQARKIQRRRIYS